MKVRRFDVTDKIRWDAFVKSSKNGTFLFLRDYMEYHSDRFEDHSLLIFDNDDNLVALLPANAEKEVIASHNGLTYGGFVFDEKISTPRCIEVFDALFEYFRGTRFKKMLYKTIPHIYHRVPAEEDRYALFLRDAVLYRRDVLAVVRANKRLPYQERRSRGVKKAQKNDVCVRQIDDFKNFWAILEDNLSAMHGVKPVHSISEIEMLAGRFPENIKLFTAHRGGSVLGGVVIYESETTAHVQYISSNGEGRSFGALDIVFDYLLTDYYKDKPYFDFGISNENNGRYLNRGLIEQKEGFGARVVVHDSYTLEITG